jgi:large subunit ribosomal protein L22
MGQSANPRRVTDTQSMAVGRLLRISARKLNVVAGSIRGKSASAALAELTFSKRRIARDVKKVLQSAIANAENNHQLDVDKLQVVAATVGKAIIMKRFFPAGRGRSGVLRKPFSNITVVVQERADREEKA